MPMVIDSDETPDAIITADDDASTVPQVDLESDVLREFLESDTASLTATDDVGIEQMLMA